MGNREQIYDMNSLTAKYIKALNSHKVQNSAIIPLSSLLAAVISWEGVFVDLSHPPKRSLTSSLSPTQISFTFCRVWDQANSGNLNMTLSCQCTIPASSGSCPVNKRYHSKRSHDCSALSEQLHGHQCPKNLAGREAIWCLLYMAHVWNTSKLVRKLAKEGPSS